jgi:hypothetical protein
MAAVVPHSTLLLVDRLDEPSLARYRIEHAGSRQSFVDAVGATVGDESELQYLVGSQWLTASEFVAEPGSAVFAPKHVRCASRNKSGAPPLAIAWRKFRSVTFAQGLASDLLIGGHRVVLPSATDGGDDGPHGATGKTLWDGAILLASYLSAYPELVKGKACLELGAGQVTMK